MATLPDPIRITDFSGGINLKDAAYSMPQNDLIRCQNMTIDEQGGINSRLGFSKYNSSVFGGGLVSNVFYWKGGGNVITQAGNQLYKDTNTVSFKTFTTTARCAFADFHGKLIFVHPVDGLFSYDGTTVTAIAAGPKADAIAVFQNKLWTNDRDATHPKSRVNFCAVGDETTWASTVDVRDVDDDQVVAVFSGQGQDIKGAPGLLVFKRRSAYRINDATNGSYTTIDPFVGAASSLAVAACLGRIVVLSEAGVFTTDGVNALTKASAKLDPFFTPIQLDLTMLNLFCAGSTNDRVYLSVSSNGTQDVMIEFHPTQGWFTLNTNGSKAYAWDGTNLYSGSPSVSGQVWTQLSTGQDNSTNITAWFQTSWIEPNAGMEGFLNRIRVNGRGSFTVGTAINYDPGSTSSPLNSRSLTLAAGNATTHGSFQDIYNMGRGKSFSIFATAISSTTGFIPIGLPSHSTRKVGAWGVYGYDLNQNAALGRA